MTPVLKSEYRILSGNPTLTSIAQDERAPLQTIIARGKAYAKLYDVYLFTDNPPAVTPPQVAKRKPVSEWNFTTSEITYDIVDYVPVEVEGWQAEVAMKATHVDLEDEQSQTIWARVQDLIAAMPDGIEKLTAQTVLARGRIRRDSPTLASLSAMVPLSEARVDDLMRLADSIQA